MKEADHTRTALLPSPHAGQENLFWSQRLRPGPGEDADPAQGGAIAGTPRLEGGVPYVGRRFCVLWVCPESSYTRL